MACVRKLVAYGLFDNIRFPQYFIVKYYKKKMHIEVSVLRLLAKIILISEGFLFFIYFFYAGWVSRQKFSTATSLTQPLVHYSDDPRGQREYIPVWEQLATDQTDCKYLSGNNLPRIKPTVNTCLGTTCHGSNRSVASCSQTGIYTIFPPVDFNCVCCCHSRCLSREWCAGAI